VAGEGECGKPTNAYQNGCEDVYVTVIGHGNRAMGVYSTLPSRYMGEALIADEPSDCTPPRLPLNHPPTRSLPNITKRSRFSAFIIGISCTAINLLIIGVLLGCFLYFGMIPRNVNQSGTIQQTLQGNIQ